MTTNFQTLLKISEADPAFSDNADHFFGHVDNFLSATAKAIIADGLPREKVMAMFIDHAFSIMYLDKPVPDWKQADDVILKVVLSRLSEGDPRKAA